MKEKKIGKIIELVETRPQLIRQLGQEIIIRAEKGIDDETSKVFVEAWKRKLHTIAPTELAQEVEDIIKRGRF